MAKLQGDINIDEKRGEYILLKYPNGKRRDIDEKVFDSAVKLYNYIIKFNYAINSVSFSKLKSLVYSSNVNNYEPIDCVSQAKAENK